MDISIVLATYKRPEILQRTLKSLSNLQCGSLIWDLWVVDNAGDSETEAIVKCWSDILPVTYIVERKVGKNNALNRAITFASGKFIVFTDDDIIASPDWLSQLWKGATRWPDNKVFGGRIIADWPDTVPYWGDIHPLNQSLFALHYPFENEQLYGDSTYLPYGPNVMIKREIFDRGYRYNPDIGPTSSVIYRMGSETELLQRLKNDGFIPVYLPDAFVRHQIRPQQLTPLMLNRRNFRIGFSDVNHKEVLACKNIFGCERYLWKQLFFVQLDRFKYYILRNRRMLFEKTAISWRIRGKVYAQRKYSGALGSSFIQKMVGVK